MSEDLRLSELRRRMTRVTMKVLTQELMQHRGDYLIKIFLDNYKRKKLFVHPDEGDMEW